MQLLLVDLRRCALLNVTVQHAGATRASMLYTPERPACSNIVSSRIRAVRPAGDRLVLPPKQLTACSDQCCNTLVALLQQEDTLWGAVHVQHSSSSGWPPLPPASAAAETAAIRQWVPPLTTAPLPTCTCTHRIIDRTVLLPPCRLLGAAGCTYGRYVERVLHAGTLPQIAPVALLLQRIVISAFEGHWQVRR